MKKSADGTDGKNSGQSSWVKTVVGQLFYFLILLGIHLLTTAIVLNLLTSEQ